MTRAWAVKQSEVHDRRFFDMVPPNEHFLSEAKPLILKGFLPKAECERMIEANKGKNLEAAMAPQGKGGANIVKTSYKNSKQLASGIEWGQINEYFSPKAFKSAINHHWGLNWSYDWIPEFRNTLFSLYEKDTYCRNHPDVIIDEAGVLHRPTRRLTVLGYLSAWSYAEDIPGRFSGGELIFPSIVDEDDEPFTFRPGVGDVIIFPANPHYYHLVSRVTSGQRYVLLNALRRI